MQLSKYNAFMMSKVGLCDRFDFFLPSDLIPSRLST